jgi:hypothetical protein
MKTIMTWGGKFFGWTAEDGLYARNGRHVGQLYRGIVYAENGNYIGELRDDRLITDVLRKETHRWYGFFANPEALTGPNDNLTDEAARPFPDGYEEFPNPETFAAK